MTLPPQLLGIIWLSGEVKKTNTKIFRKLSVVPWIMNMLCELQNFDVHTRYTNPFDVLILLLPGSAFNRRYLENGAF